MKGQYLTQGNVAKLYCLDFIDRLASRNGVTSILDLGCGSGANFVALLSKYPSISYVGVDPSLEACRAARNALGDLNAEIRNEHAYGLDSGPADVVVSFSVLEHVRHRRSYFQCVKRNLAPDGFFLINYDAGHFVLPDDPLSNKKQLLLKLAASTLAALRRKGLYESFVYEQEFRTLAEDSGLRIIDEKMFNTDLKNVYKLVPPEYRDEFTTRWADMELYLNTLGIVYLDRMAPVFRTRNFILTHSDGPTRIDPAI